MGDLKMLEDGGYKLMGAAFEVYNELGHGLAEEIYRQSLEIELALRGDPVSYEAGSSRLLQRSQSRDFLSTRLACME